MSTSGNTSQIGAIYEALGKLMQNPQSLGLREHLPERVVALLTSTQKILLEQMKGEKLTSGTDNDLATELSQDADTQHGIPEEEQNRMSFRRLLCSRMEQLHLSNYDVAVSLGCSIQYVSDLITGVRVPTELHIAELALLLGVSQESLATRAKAKIEGLAATV